MPNIYQISFAILPPIAACTIPAESYALVWPNDDLCAKTASISYMEIGHEHALQNRATVAIAMAWTCTSVFAALARAQCSPEGNEPTIDLGTGCQWVYRTAQVSDRIVITARTSEQRHSVWEKLPPCSCGLYQYPVPCPECPGSTVTLTIQDTLALNVTSSISNQIA